MTDQPRNFTIFSLSNTPSLEEIVGSFKNFPELAVPIETVISGGLTLYSIPTHKDKAELTIMPVFTDPGLIPPPRTARPTLSLLNTLFQAPSADIFAFNPPGHGSREPMTEVHLDKRRLSTVIGFLQTPFALPSGPELEAAWKKEAGMGNLHRANYMASAFFAANPSAPRSGAYAELLVNLGLFKETRDYTRDIQSPEFYCCMASVFRLSHDTSGARLWLDRIPAGTALEDKKKLELAWLELDEGRPEEALKAFQTLAQNSFEKTGALLGTGAALLKKATVENRSEIGEILNTLSSALSSPSPLTPDIFACMGDAYLQAGDHAEAETCYHKALESRPGIRHTVNLVLTLAKNGKFREAAPLISTLALIDPGSASRLATELPRDSAAQLLELSRHHPDVATAAGLGAPAPGQRLPVAGLEAVPPDAEPPPPPPPPPPRRERPVLKMESLMEAAGVSLPTEAETRKDDFLGKAFTLASMLEEETGRKIFFNADGLTEVERRLRLVFIRSSHERQKRVEIVKDSSAFLCFILQERLKGRIVKLPDFDQWGWPVIFDFPRHIVTYPVQRIWRLLWPGELPEPGWLIKYLHYVENELQSGQTDRLHGTEAVRGRTPSHPERLIDTETEHRRIMLLTTTLQETGGIEIGRSGVEKLENAVKKSFRPDIPPTADGWKLLRCYGHILAEIVIRDFKAVWYNTDGNDGLWSLLTPWNTFVFPIGKIYKTASRAESLRGYYDALHAERLQASDGTKK